MEAYMYRFECLFTGQRYAVSATDIDNAWRKLEEYCADNDDSGVVADRFRHLDMDMQGVLPL